MTRNIFEELRFEHDQHRRLIEEIRATSGDSQLRRRLLREFVRETEAHASAEERVFYSRLLEDSGTRDKSAHSIEEHQRMRDGVAKLEATDLSSPAWLRLFSTVSDEFEHHMKEEEHGVFQLAGKALTEHEKKALVAKFRDTKRAELAH